MLWWYLSLGEKRLNKLQCMNGLYVNIGILVAVRHLSWFCCCNNWCPLQQPKPILGYLNKMMLFEWKIRILRNFLSWKIWRLESLIMEMLIFILLTLRGYLSIFNYFVLILLNSVLYALKLYDLKADHSIVLFFPPSTGFCFNKTREKSWLC